jgi:hypothetical protein
MAQNYLVHEFQLKRQDNGVSILAAGGVALVVAAGGTDRVALYNPDNSFAALAQPIALNYGTGRFAVLDTVNSVDIYIMGPEGDFVVIEDVVAGSISEVMIDMQRRVQMLKLPYSVADSTANTETDTGFDLPAGAVVLPWGAGVRVAATDATEDLEVGLLSSESGGDTDGFINNIAISGANGSTTMAQALITVGSNEQFFASTTLGVLLADFLAGADVAGDVGTNNPKHAVISTARSIVYLTSAGTDTAKGWFFFQYMLPQR